MRKIVFIFLVFSFFACQGPEPGQGPGPHPGAERPNILFIMTDQQSATMMSCTGNTYLKTPSLDQLAASGMRFELAYSPNPVCIPSRTSMMTGYFPSSFEYFSQPMYWRADYGYKGDFKSEVVNLYIENKVLLDDTNEEIIRKVMYERNWVSEMEAVLTCIKPARKADKQLRSAPRLQILKRGTDLNPEGQNGIGAQGKQMKEVRNDSNDSTDKDNVELVD